MLEDDKETRNTRFSMAQSVTPTLLNDESPIANQEDQEDLSHKKGKG